MHFAQAKYSIGKDGIHDVVQIEKQQYYFRQPPTVPVKKDMTCAAIFDSHTNALILHSRVLTIFSRAALGGVVFPSEEDDVTKTSQPINHIGFIGRPMPSTNLGITNQEYNGLEFTTFAVGSNTGST